VEGHRHLGRLIVGAASAALLVLPTAASARERPNASAASDGSGIDVVFTRHEDGSVTGAPRAAGSSCTWSAVPVDPSQAAGVREVPDQPDPDAELYAVFCDAEYRGLAWLGARNFVDAPTQPVVDELVRRIEVLPATVSVRPDSRGVTGIPSLFWVEGYDGAPITETLSAFGLDVAVTATMTEVVWDFGDGTPPVRAGLGEAWPQRSSVQHNYADPSPSGGYVVTARVTFAPSFTVNGGAATALDPIVVTFTRTHVVRQVQAVRNA
jgi:hypothetical protein